MLMMNFSSPSILEASVKESTSFAYNLKTGTYAWVRKEYVDSVMSISTQTYSHMYAATQTKPLDYYLGNNMPTSHDR